MVVRLEINDLIVQQGKTGRNTFVCLGEPVGPSPHLSGGIVEVKDLNVRKGVKTPLSCNLIVRKGGA